MEDQRIIRVIDQFQRRAVYRTIIMERRLLRNMEQESNIILTALPWTAPYVHHNTAAQPSTMRWDRTDDHFIISDNNQNLRRNFGIIRQGHLTLRNLEKIRIEEGEESDCSICLMELSVGTEAIRLPSPCSHVYHEGCIMRWLNTSRTCPLCRRLVV